ncbi:MAG: hypothetical protein H8E44_07735 [Planctomycetes bacterium]|nr:hypothetical protein [Planctomycetota bacterium]
MNRIACLLLLTAFGAIATGCGRDAPPANGGGSGGAPRGESQSPNNERDAVEYTSAEVRVIYGRLANRTKRIEDQAEIGRLLSFFPGVGRGQHSPVAEPWEGAVKVHLTKADRSVVRVWSDYESWNEGHGDWPVKPGFADYVRKLLEE